MNCGPLQYCQLLTSNTGYQFQNVSRLRYCFECVLSEARTDQHLKTENVRTYRNKQEIQPSFLLFDVTWTNFIPISDKLSTHNIKDWGCYWRQRVSTAYFWKDETLQAKLAEPRVKEEHDAEIIFTTITNEALEVLTHTGPNLQLNRHALCRAWQILCSLH